MLQKSRASPIFGFTESPSFPQSDSSFHQGTELIFPLAEGNTVSPPSSTSELYHYGRENFIEREYLGLQQMHQSQENLEGKMLCHSQIHKNCSHALTPIFSVELIKEVVKMRLIFLSNFIVEYLKSFPVLCL
jgi:hypothetical protein